MTDTSQEDLGARRLEERDIGYGVLRLGKRINRDGYIIRKTRDKGIDKASGQGVAVAATPVMGLGLFALSGIVAILMRVLGILIRVVVRGRGLVMRTHFR